MDAVLEQYFNNLCECGGCTTFQINTQCLQINGQFININQ